MPPWFELLEMKKGPDKKARSCALASYLGPLAMKNRPNKAVLASFIFQHSHHNTGFVRLQFVSSPDLVRILFASCSRFFIQEGTA